MTGRVSSGKETSGLEWSFLLLCTFLVLWAMLVSWIFNFLPVDQAALEAARVQAQVIQAVSQGAAHRGLAIDLESDRHATGMIGEAYTGLTSTQGSLPAKRTAATPDAAALLVALLREAGVGAGSRVAVNASGSFPGFALAAVSACGALGAEAVTVLSIGSSTWGANRPGYNILDMFMAVADAGVWPAGYPTAIAALSPGGSDDQGLDLDPEALEPALARATVLGIPVLRPQSLDEAISSRMTLFRSVGEPDVLLIIGGNHASTGADPDLALLSGVIWPEGSRSSFHSVFRSGSAPGSDSSSDSGSASDSGVTARTGAIGVSGGFALAGSNGLMQEFLHAGRPVIQVLNIEDLGARYGLSYDPVTVPPIGRARVYRHGASRGLGLGQRLVILALMLLPVVGAVVAFARYRRHFLINVMNER